MSSDFPANKNVYAPYIYDIWFRPTLMMWNEWVVPQRPFEPCNRRNSNT